MDVNQLRRLRSALVRGDRLRPVGRRQTSSARYAGSEANNGKLALAEKALNAARNSERERPLEALGEDLRTARISADVLARQPNDRAALNVYNFAVGRTIENIQRSGIEPWHHAVAIQSYDGAYLLHTAPSKAQDQNPSNYTLLTVDTLKVGGVFFSTRSTAPGIGAPLVAIEKQDAADFRARYQPKRVYAAVTCVIRFRGRRAEIELIDRLNSEHVTLNGQTYPLAADFSAPLAIALAREQPDRHVLRALFRPAEFTDSTRLIRLQSFDPQRTPVIFIHGLDATFTGGAPMINTLRDDPQIRRRYQFWVFGYPSGLPFSYTAALLRRQLDGVQRAFPNRKHVVLIGHSMGGLVCRLMATDADDKIWEAFFHK